MTDRDLVETAQPAALADRTAPLLDQELAQGKWELARGAGVLSNERVNPLITAEAIPGSQLDLSGVEVSITGTAVEDRRISGRTVHLGRVMVGSEALAINRTDNLTLRTTGSDDVRTRLHLEAFDLQNADAGISAKHATGADFTSDAATSQVEIAGTFTRTADTLGWHTRTINAGAHISTLENGGAGLAGENTQNALSLGYRWNVVDNNNLISRDFVVFENVGAQGRRSFHNSSVGHEFDTDTHTNVGFDRWVEIDGTFAAGQHNLGVTTLNAANGRVTGEGLEGENVIASTSFETTLVAIKGAEQSITASKAGPLTTGDTITIKDEGVGIYQFGTEIVDVALNGDDKLDYNLSLEGGATIGRGQESVVTIQYTGEDITPEAGELGRVKRTSFDLTLSDFLDMQPFFDLTDDRSWTRNGLEYSTSHHSFDLETRFDAPASATGTVTVAQGTNFRGTGLSLVNAEENQGSRFSTATQFELIDSQTLPDAATVNVSFTSVDDLDPTRLDALENNDDNEASRAGVFGYEASAPIAFSSDIVSLEGLDGLFQVVQLTVNETLPGIHQVVWETSYTDADDAPQTAWVNAVLGNSNVTSLDLLNGTLLIEESVWLIGDYLEENQFLGSYVSYLQSVEQAELGAWGFDADGKRAWAVIDHNSDFAAAVPEPGTYALLFGLAGLGYALVRHRSAR